MKKFASVLLSMMLATGLAAGASAETYTGTAQGMGGDVSVTLTVEDGKITAAEVVGENETKGIGYEPCAEGTYAAAIVEAQGADIDNISGATVTTNAVKEAAKKAMAVSYTHLDVYKRQEYRHRSSSPRPACPQTESEAPLRREAVWNPPSARGTCLPRLPAADFF